jgi:hypothetical protein
VRVGVRGGIGVCGGIHPDASSPPNVCRILARFTIEVISAAYYFTPSNGGIQLVPFADISSADTRLTSCQGGCEASYSMISYLRPQVFQLAQGAMFGSRSQRIAARRFSSAIASSKVTNSPCGSACASSSIMNIESLWRA